MTLEYDCPHCNCTMTVERDAAGREFVCPGCRVFFTLPTPLRMTKREARRKLLPYAIGLAIEGAVCLLIGVRSVFAVGEHQVPVGANDNDVLGALIMVCIITLALGGVLLAAAWAAFRAQNRILIVIGIALGTLLLFCCCFAVGFLLLSAPTPLYDPLLRQAIDDPE